MQEHWNLSKLTSAVKHFLGIRIDFAALIRIRIRIDLISWIRNNTETIADSQHCSNGK
jgi:hypothetical protein